MSSALRRSSFEIRREVPAGFFVRESTRQLLAIPIQFLTCKSKK